MTTQTIGPVLAQAVAQALRNGKTLIEQHPEYCGIGLAMIDGQFVCAEVYDGQITTPQQAQNMRIQGQQPECLVFATETEFITWLAAQSDHSLSGHDLAHEWARGNQRLTLARLQAFAA
ncbi:hypothetical protein V8J88_16940 [Massilia sp. W12]|uniref:hypothetical protein n=1 Tax=Massilia sp. W12 TaxID=3126507 RepID=UPI0030D513A6